MNVNFASDSNCDDVEWETNFEDLWRLKKNENKGELTDSLLDQVATRIVSKDWEKLIVNLGFLEYDIKGMKRKHGSNQFEAVGLCF